LARQRSFQVQGGPRLPLEAFSLGRQSRPAQKQNLLGPQSKADKNVSCQDYETLNKIIKGKGMKEVGKKGTPGLLFFMEKFIKETGLFEPGARILAGVSGGPDSMALLSLLTELRPKWNLEVMAIYCHHGLRAAADEEEYFVKFWAQKWGCPFFSRRLSVRNFQRESKMSLQEAARELRYRAFLEYAERRKADRVALAHTADDQAEEVLIGLIRGAALGGLAGIPVRRGPFIRPLIRTYRAEILNYLKERNVPFLEDLSNRDFRYLRARVRHHLLPDLKKYSPNIVAQLNQTAGLLQKDEEYLQGKVDALAGKVISCSGDLISIQRSKLAELPQAMSSRLIQKAVLSSLGRLRHIRAAHILSIIAAAQGKRKEGRIILPDGWSVQWDRDILRITPAAPDPEPAKNFTCEIDRPRKVCIPETGEIIFFRKIKRPLDPPLFQNDKNLARVDFDKLDWPLMIRNMHPGDRFQPLGMKGSKKVSRFFIDRKVPKYLRSRIPLVLSRGEIVWIAGMEIGQAFCLDPRSSRALEMEYLFKPI
jgi:tRNA(Ile)-lysidine synthase